MAEVLHSSSSSSHSSISSPPHAALSHGDIKSRDSNSKELSFLTLLVSLFRKSFFMACKVGNSGEMCCSSGGGGGKGMEIGWPTNVKHVAHVTFDRFNGFLGLPIEFEPEVPRRAPSAMPRYLEFPQNPCSYRMIPEETVFQQFSCRCKGGCTIKKACRRIIVLCLCSIYVNVLLQVPLVITKSRKKKVP